MNLDKETQEKIQEMQSYEQTLHALLIQKQAFQIELTETENALSEIEKSKDDIFKIVGNIMVKAEKKQVESELKKKKELLSLRLKSIESQETKITDKADELKKEVMKKIK
ncbi:MAG: prefoldin subunit beta [Nanoarchaeota archaeon]